MTNEEMVKLAKRLDCYAYNFDIDHATHVIDDLKAAAAVLRTISNTPISIPKTDSRTMALLKAITGFEFAPYDSGSTTKY